MAEWKWLYQTLSTAFLLRNPTSWGAAAWNTIWTHEILENGIPTIDLANQREIFWISYYGTYAYDKDSSGYNMTLGGNSHVCKEETKQKISAARKGYRVTEDVKHRLSELNSGNGNPFYGQHHSEKTKKTTEWAI